MSHPWMNRNCVVESTVKSQLRKGSGLIQDEKYRNAYIEKVLNLINIINNKYVNNLSTEMGWRIRYPRFSLPRKKYPMGKVEVTGPVHHSESIDKKLIY